MCWASGVVGRAVLSGVFSLLVVGSAQATVKYTYTGLDYPGNGINSFKISISFETSLSAAQLKNLPAGSDISSTLTSFTMTDGGPPPQDKYGFPSGYFSLVAPPGAVALPDNVFQIGTNSSGAITSWTISQAYFVSYPNSPDENPAFFYGEYNMISTQVNDQTILIVDNNVGMNYPGGSSTGAGVWSAGESIPEPASLGLLTLASTLCLRRRRVR